MKSSTLFVTLLFATIISYATRGRAVENLLDNKVSKETLIITEKTANLVSFKQSHAGLIKIVEDLGYKVTLKAADDGSLKFSNYGEYLYDNILILAPAADAFRSSSSVQNILEFIDAGHNVLLAGNNAPGSITDDIASEVGFKFRESSVRRDYTNSKLNDIYYIVGNRKNYQSASFFFAGTQLKMLKNPLAIEILSNNAPVDDIRPSSSSKYSDNVLIGAVQARNNARVVVSGSTEFFSDKAFDSSKSANKQLTTELLRWMFKEKSLLRSSQVTHRKLNVDPEPSNDVAMKTNFEGYTIMDDVEYSIKIEIYDNGKWSPYTGDDVQLEFVRIDPFVRQTMQRRPDGVYVAEFKVPDVYGVYRFQVDYKKEGLTHLYSATQVSVRPLRHNQYERFIYSAYPYYLSAFLMIAYLYIFSFVYLYQPKRNNK